MNPYVLGMDIWEGSLKLDEQVLWEGGIRFLIHRLNDMNGGHHLDATFKAKWEEYQLFVKWPYFVYNPWVSGAENAAWMMDNLPVGYGGHVSVDVEVVFAGYSARDYYLQVHDFLDEVKPYHNLDIYTGAWFLPYLSSWPSNVHYWWARYPSAFYPTAKQSISFEKLHQMVAAANWNPGSPPGPCNLWQISGDKLILPGAIRTMDVNVFNGTEEDLVDYLGILDDKDQSFPPATPLSWGQQITNWARSKGYSGIDPEA